MFLIVVIGLALLAFIVGDALTNSRNLFGDNTTVAKIGSKKIDYHDYQRKREELNNQLENARRQNPQSVANFDTQLLPAMAVNQLVTESLIDEAVEKLDIRSSADQLRYYMLETQSNPQVMTLLQQMAQAGLQVQNPQQAYEMIFNPKRNGLTDAQVAPYQRAWLSLEEETKQMAKRQTYARLVMNAFKANELDKKAMYNDYIATRNVSVAFKPYGAIDEKKYTVSDAEIKAEYDKNKNKYKVDEATKAISFIAVNIAPSVADIEACKQLAQSTLASLSGANGSVSKEARKEGVSVERKQLRASDINNETIKNYVLGAPKDSVKLVVDNARGFTIVKMASRSAEVDSVQLNIVSVAGSSLPAKVLAQLNAGLSLDSIASKFSADSVQTQKEQWIPLYTANGPTNALEKSQLDSLRNAGGKYVPLISQAEGTVYASIAKQNSPVEIYEYDEVTYQLNPSTKTVSDERTKLEKFLASNNTAEKFSANASKAGYSVQNFKLTPSSPAVPRMQGMNMYFPESRQVVRWVVMDGSEGNVSGIFEDKDAAAPALYAVAIDSEYEDYTPVTDADVKRELTNKIRRSKAGDDMVKEYSAKGKTVEAVAQAMGVEPSVEESFRFARNGSVRDAAIVGMINGLPAGKGMKVVKGENGVYAFSVNSIGKENFAYNDDQYASQYMQVINPNFEQMLRGSKKFVNKSYKFEAAN